MTSAEELRDLGVLSRLDYELGVTLLELVNERTPEVQLAISLASWAVQRGHVCADLAQIHERGFFDEEGNAIEGVTLPQLEPWCELLKQSPLVHWGPVAGAPRPLVLADPARLYLARYHAYEQRLARALLARAAVVHDDLDGKQLVTDLETLFSAQPEVMDQRRACLLAALRGLSVISGGPGTGKTFSVARLLIALQQQAQQRGKPYEIVLLAPTGKAAQRLSESLRGNLEGIAPELRAVLPHEAFTIHRKLGFQPGSPTRFRHDSSNPLQADVVIVDETSMVDLALMAKLVDAVRPQARLVLLGDKDQLASVEAGAILGDIYGGHPQDGYSASFVSRVQRLTGESLPRSQLLPEPGLHDGMVHLTHVHRFQASSPIAQLAVAINQGNAEEVLRLLDRGDDAVTLTEVAVSDSLEKIISSLAIERFAPLMDAALDVKLQHLSAFRFLCAHRRGAFGVEALNRFVEAQLTEQGLLSQVGQSAWYEGRPILVTANDYDVELFNGDVGVVARDPAGVGQRLVAVFPGVRQGDHRRFSLGQLPAHESVFAMSVHKAQGSEIDEVALVLPPHISPVLTRELLYTGVTRARRKVHLFASRAVLERAVLTPVQRASGLREALWGAPGHTGATAL